MSKLDVLIVNWNGLHFCKDLIPEVLDKWGEVLGRLIVVDNASTDGSQAWIAENYPSVCLVLSDENLGYARGNNLALNSLVSEYVLLLNNDTRVIDENMAKLVVEEFDSNPSVGALSPTLILADGSFQSGAAGFDRGLRSFIDYFWFLSRILPNSFPFYLDQKKYKGLSSLVAVDWVSGAAMAVRRDVLLQVGGVPDDFFMYAEDIKLCRSIREKGKSVAYFPSCRMLHYHGASENSAGVKTRWIDSTINEYARRSGAVSANLAKLVFSTGFLARGVAYFLKYLGGNSNSMASAKRMFVYAKSALFSKIA